MHRSPASWIERLVARSAISWGLLAALLVAGCGPGEGPPPSWRLLTADLDRALLSVHVRAEDEVYFVGGAMLTGGQALALRYDGQRAEQLTGAEDVDTLWWVCSAPDGPIWFVGEGGAIFRLRSGETALQRVDSPVGVTLYGCWAPSPTEAWAVGGDARGDGDKDVVLRYDGTNWQRVTLPDPQGVTLFKVWGDGAGDVFVVGERSTVLRYDGTSWQAEPVEGGGGRLLTVHANGPSAWAVGGGGPGGVVLQRQDDGRWVRQTLPDLASDLNGVAVAPDGRVLAVGARLTGWLRQDGQWEDLADTLYMLGAEAVTTRAPVDLHGVAFSPDGNEAYAVGGTLVPVPGQPLQGLILHYAGEARGWQTP